MNRQDILTLMQRNRATPRAAMELDGVLMPGEIWEVEPVDGDRWMVRRAGTVESESTHPSIEAAIEHARKLAREHNGEARVIDRAGRLTGQWTFGDFRRPT